MLLRGDSLPASEWSILCGAVWTDRPGHGFFSIVCGADGGIFIPIFQQLQKGDVSDDDAQTGKEQHLVQGPGGPGY